MKTTLDTGAISTLNANRGKKIPSFHARAWAKMPPDFRLARPPMPLPFRHAAAALALLLGLSSLAVAAVTRHAWIPTPAPARLPASSPVPSPGK
jgi:hypothetical protein